MKINISKFMSGKSLISNGLKIVPNEILNVSISKLKQLSNKPKPKDESIFNKKWKHILSEIKYNDADNFEILSKTITDCSKSWKGEDKKFESRLLCKFDSSDELCEVLKEKKVNCLAINNGTYILTKANIYQTVTNDASVEIIKIKKDTNSVLLSIGDSEKSFVDNLCYSNVFQLYLETPIKYHNLLGGRHRLPKIETTLGSKKIIIEGVQYETDSAYESDKSILIIEAKNKMCCDFNLRQIYYPYRVVQLNKKLNKKIIPLFICNDKTSGIIYIWQLEFTDIHNMNSCKIVDLKKFQFE